MVSFTHQASGDFVVEEKTIPRTMGELRNIAPENLFIGNNPMTNLSDVWFSIHDNYGFILHIVKGVHLIKTLYNYIGKPNDLLNYSVAIRESRGGVNPNILYGYCFISDKMHDVYARGVDHDTRLEASVLSSFQELMSRAPPNSYARLYCAELNETTGVAVVRTILEDYSKMSD